METVKKKIADLEKSKKDFDKVVEKLEEKITSCKKLIVKIEKIKAK